MGAGRELLRLGGAGGGGGGGGARVAVAPWRGGKITSLIGPGGGEWLAPCAGGRLLDGASGRAFTDAEMGGWDECAPTIDAAVLPDGTALTDHGDLWDVAWEVEAEPGSGDAIVTVGRGRDWPYVLRRTVRVDGTRVVLDYAVTSGDVVARPFLWAAHPQFLAPAGSRVVIEGAPTMVRTDPGPAQPVEWDPALPDLPAGSCGKWWSPRDAQVRAARLDRPDGSSLTVRASGAAVRWLGVWSDAGVYSVERVVALEPATGWYDDAARALAEGTVLVLEPGETAAWSLEVELSG